MAKLKSEYLGKEFEVTSFEAQEEGETVEVVSHAALEYIAHNLLPKELGVKYDLIPLLLSPNHCVVKCVFADDTNRRIIAIGEAVLNTLSTEIARNHPATMAFNRAFDRALLRYLNVPGKVLSNSESNPTNDAVNDGETVVNVGEAAQKPVEAPQSDVKGGNGVTAPQHENAPQRAPESRKEPPAPKQAPSAQGNAAPRANQPANNKASSANNTGASSNLAELGKVECNVGQYRNTGTTVAQLYEKNRNYFNFICTKYSANGAEAQRIRNACLQYRALMEGNSDGQH